MGLVNRLTSFKFVMSISLIYMSAVTIAQRPVSPNSPAVATPAPFPLQVKKTIVFLENDCLQDLNPQAGLQDARQFAQMPVNQQIQIAQQLIQALNRLNSVKVSVLKLSPEEQSRLNGLGNATAIPSDLPSEIVWRISILQKMVGLTDKEFAALTPNELAAFPSYQVRGTGFLVGFIDPRINKPPGSLGTLSFRYLVTNRHVAQPGIENGRPCKILRSFVLMNHKPDRNHNNPYSELVNLSQGISWILPDDASVDLAATSFGYPDELYDHYTILTNQFVTEDDLKKNLVVEGDPVMFAGLFVQTFDEVHTLEPIVRSGTLAMIPTEPIPTVLQKRPGNVLLADAHVFGGNSGSPMFVDTNKFVSGLGYSYKLLGVISGELYENSDLSMNVVTTIQGNVAANSDVSIVVPATEIMALLNNKKLQEARDDFIAHQPPAPAPK